MNAAGTIVFNDVSKFYGEILGVNRVSLSIPPGITSLVGPNGSGKTTLMNLITGLLWPNDGSISVLGVSPRDAESLFRLVGYATQIDAFPRGARGRDFVVSYLRVHGYANDEAQRRADAALARLGLTEAGSRRIAGYSKGMRQRVKLAQAMAHDPRVLVLDEPLNGLDPLVRAEIIALLREWVDQGRHVIVSSHILHEVDLISDQVVLLNEGYVVAEGDIRGVRSEMRRHPLQVLIRCRQPGMLAARIFELDTVVEVKLHVDGGGLLVATRDPDRFYLSLNRIAVDHDLGLETVCPADDDVDAVYRYLIGGEEGS